MTPDQITQMATLAGARPGFDNQADMAFLQDLAALVADATTAPLHARIADLEAQLYAIGAGGVGQSIKPQVQADTAQEPVAWRVRPFDYGIGHEGVDALTTRKEQCEMWERKGWKVEPLYTAPQPTENLRCKSTQKRLATLWGYEKARQPLPAEAFTALAHRIASKYTHRSDPSFSGYAFLPHTLEQFVRAIESAHGITGGQP